MKENYHQINNSLCTVNLNISSQEHICIEANKEDCHDITKGKKKKIDLNGNEISHHDRHDI
jgi:hypothetical protein